jgi:D-alanyl-D-alanine carboxypeptidase/D-alanyl-D-alanine-endopeptidase (penicillin-binding protein 4)
LDKHFSAPLKDVLTVMLKRSQNLYAETFARALGLNATGKGTFRAGKKVVEDVLENFGVPKGTYRYMDGSGLSRYDYISPDQILKILIAMRNSADWEIWYNALPVAGVDGTLRNRMKGSAAEGNVHAKTGTISNVRALSGYVTTASGEMLAFSFLVNAHLMTSKDTEGVTDGILELLASYKGSF